MSFSPCDRIANTSFSKISKSVFEFLSYDQGSAIYASSSYWILSIESCLFRQCISNRLSGAISVTLRSFTMIGACFDTCYFSQTSDSDIGKAISAMSTSLESSEANLNFTSFQFCSPDRSISGGSTVYFSQLPLVTASLNFSKCSAGVASLWVTESGKASFIDVIAGKSSHISATSGNALLSFIYSNFIGWSQYEYHSVFYGENVNTVLEFCSIFVSGSWGTLGKVSFLQYCYGNLGGNVISTLTTEFPLTKMRADDYCNIFINLENSCHIRDINRCCIMLYLMNCSVNY